MELFFIEICLFIDGRGRLMEGGQRTICGGGLSPSTMRGVRLELRWSGLAVSTFTPSHLPRPEWYCHVSS